MFHFGTKDGGPESTVRMYGFEWKRGFSVLLLRFDGPSRFAYHEHAFNAVSWLLRGGLIERVFSGMDGTASFGLNIEPNFRPIWTARDRFHKVDSIGTSWVLSLRGPWADTWREYIPGVGMRTLTHGRGVL